MRTPGSATLLGYGEPTSNRAGVDSSCVALWRRNRGADTHRLWSRQRPCGSRKDSRRRLRRCVRHPAKYGTEHHPGDAQLRRRVLVRVSRRPVTVWMHERRGLTMKSDVCIFARDTMAVQREDAGGNGVLDQLEAGPAHDRRRKRKYHQQQRRDGLAREERRGWSPNGHCAVSAGGSYRLALPV